MTKFGLILIFVAFGLTFGFGQKPIEKPEWKEFASEDFKFKATFPGTPKSSVNELDAKSGKRYAHWFTVSLPQRFYGVSVTDFPNLPLMATEEQLRTNYDTLRDGTVQQLGFKLVREKDLRLDGQFGREMVAGNDKEIVIDRMFLVRQRLYQIITTMPLSSAKDEAAQRDAAKFLDSFQFAAIKSEH